MAQNKAINLKVFIKESWEARRFTVDESVCTNYVFMKEKLLTIFPQLKHTDFRVTWKDNDGDEITIANDEDFITAFTEMTDNVKVLYISTESRRHGKHKKHHPHGGFRHHGCPFPAPGMDLKDVHSLGAMAKQYLGPWLESLSIYVDPSSDNESPEKPSSSNERRAQNECQQQPPATSQPEKPKETTDKPMEVSSSPSPSPTAPAPTSAAPPVNHPDPKIAAGLTQLQQMGFHNDNGYLTNLLTYFNGNVAAVIKAITD